MSAMHRAAIVTPLGCKRRRLCMRDGDLRPRSQPRSQTRGANHRLPTRAIIMPTHRVYTRRGCVAGPCHSACGVPGVIDETVKCAPQNTMVASDALGRDDMQVAQVYIQLYMFCMYVLCVNSAYSEDLQGTPHHDRMRKTTSMSASQKSCAERLQ